MNNKEEIMSLIPAFELGFWNAWILVLPIIIASMFGAKTLSKRKSTASSSVPKKVKQQLSFIFQ